MLQKFVHCDMTTIILFGQYKSIITEYELVNVKINKSKIDVLVENKLLRKEVSFIQVSKKIILHISKHLNNAALVVFF